MVNMDRKTVIVGIVVIAIVAAAIGFYAFYVYPQKTQGSGKIVVKDDMGRTVILNKTADRVVSLAPSNTEILFAIGAGSKVVGVTEFCDYPPEAVEGVKNGSIAVVGGFASDISIEKIVSLKPDAVFAYYGQKSVVEELENLSIPTVVFNPHNLDMIYNDITIAGEITGMNDGAKKVISEMRNTVNYVESHVANLPAKKVFFVAWGNPLMTAGNDTFINYLISLADGKNIFSDSSGWPTVSMESIVARNPDAIILTPHCGLTKKDVLNNWSNEINAVKNGSVYVIDDDILVRPGPRIVQGLLAIAEDIHPNAFEEKSYNLEVTEQWAVAAP